MTNKQAYAKQYYQDHKEAFARYLKANRAKHHKEIPWDEKYSRAGTARFKKARQQARDRHLAWEIPPDTYEELVKRPCAYCEQLLPATGGCLDRKDSSKGYLLDNVCPCCYSCNTVKNSILSYEQMKVAMQAIKEKGLWPINRREHPFAPSN